MSQRGGHAQRLRLLPAMLMLGGALTTSVRAQSSYYQAVTSLGPVAYWPLQETNQPPINDVETNLGTLGPVANAVYPSTAVVRGAGGAIVSESDSSAFFNTTEGSYLAVPTTDPRVAISSPSFTVEAWVNPANFGGFVGILSQSGANPGGLNGTTNQAGWCLSAQYVPSLDNANLRGFSFHVYNGQSLNGNGAPRGGAEVVVPFNYSLSTWYHLVATYDGTNCSMYINGTNMSSVGYRVAMPAGTSFLPDSWDPLCIGCSRGMHNNRYDGQIDEVAIYTNVLTAAQVLNHYQTALNPSPAVPYEQVITNDNAYMYWRMDAPAYSAPDPSTYPTASYYSAVPGFTMNVASGSLANSVYGTATKPGMPGPQFQGMLDPSLGNQSYSVAINGIGGANGGTANVNIGNNVAIAESIPVDAGYNALLNPTAPPFSVTIWFKGDPADANGNTRFQTLVGHTDSGWRVSQDQNGKIHFKPGNNGTEITSARAYNDGNWHHLVATCTTTAENVYVDGVLDSTAASATTFAGSPQDVLIGGDPQYLNSGNGAYASTPASGGAPMRDYAGSLAHFAFFTNALSAAQVSTLYAAAEAPPAILGQPFFGPRVQNGGTPYLFFGVIASGSAPLYYQWYHTNANGVVALVDDNVKYVGSQTTQVTVSNLVDSDSGNYFVVISNNYGAVTSSVSVLTVYQEPAITSQTPAGGTLQVVAGQTPAAFTATVVAATNNLAYQWYTNGVAIAGATNTTLPLPAVQAANSGTVITFVATNSFGAATNSPVTLNVNQLSVPNNPYAQAMLALNPQGYWPMHENEAPLANRDVETNYGTLGAIANAVYGDWQIIDNGNPQVTFHQQPGAIANDSDTSVYFSGATGSPSGGSYAVVPRTSPLTTIKPPFTLESWVKPYNNGSFGIIFGVGSLAANSGLNSGSSEGGFDWLYSGTANTFSITVRNGSGTGSTEPKTTASYPPGQWYHVVTTYDGTNIAYYINGVQDGLQNSSAATLNPNTWAPLSIGGGRWGGTMSNLFQGQIDELAVYTNILQASDIQAHYNTGISGAAGAYKSAVLADHPLLYYRMDSPPYAASSPSTWPVLANYGSAGVQGVYKPNSVPGGVAGPSESGIPVTGFPNTALACDGNSIFADAGWDPSFAPATANKPVTVTAWFRANPADVQQRNWQTLVGHTDQSWRMNMSGGSGKVGFDSGNGLDQASAVTYNDGQWHQLVGTYDGTSVTTVYVDGKLSSTGTRTGTNNFSPFDIYLGSSPNGQSNAAGGRTFAGNMCEAAYFNGVALSAQQVSNLYAAAQVPPFYLTQPTLNTSANQNTCYTNSVTANGSGNLSYQWYTNGVAISGQTNASLVICGITPNYTTTNLYVVVSNPYGSVTSSVASLTVYSSPQFVVQPISTTLTNNISLFSGASPTFKTYAVGAQPIYYQWLTNGVPVPGATNVGYTVPTVPASGVTSLACVASNFVGAATTTTLNISTQPDPVNLYPQAVMALNPLAYWRLNEPDNGQGLGNAGAIAKDYVSGIDAIYTNSVLGVTGYNTVTDPTETAAQFGSLSSSNSFAGQVAGAVTGAGIGLSTNLVYGIDFSAPSNQNSAFSVSAWVYGTVQTVDAGIVTKGYGGGGEQFNLDTGADGGTPNHAFRWFVRNASGSTYAATSKIAPDGNWHHLVGVCDEPHGMVALYVDGILAGSSTFAPGGGILSSTNAMSIGARMSSATAQDDFQFVGSVDDVAIFNYALSALQVSNLYYTAGIAPSISQQPPTSVNVNENGTLIVNAAAVGTQPLSYQWYDLTQGMAVPNQTNASLVINNFPVTWNGENYQLTVTNIYGTVNSTTVGVTVQSGMPTLAVDLPTNSQYFTVGATFTLSPTVTGTQPFAYTWYENGAVISGATNSTYSSTAAYGTNQYYVAVTNSYGGVVSSTATIVGDAGTPPLMFPAAGSTGWSLNAGAAGAPGFTNGVLTLTDGAGSESRSSWFTTKQNISRFLAQFTYEDVTGGTAGADGITFCIQNTSSTVTGGAGGSLGVSGITPSLNFALNIYRGTTPPGPAAGWNLNGANATTSTAPVVLDNGSHPINVVLYYDGATAKGWMTDPIAGTTSPLYSMSVNLTNILNSSTAYVGFTGATGGSVAYQEVYNFSFTTINTPVLTESLSGNNVVVTWPSTTSALYDLQSATSLNGPWSTVTSGITVTNGVVQYTAPMSGTSTFYRLVLPIP